MLEVNGHRILVGIDTSGSMDTRDCPGRKDRYHYVREKAVTFVGEAVVLGVLLSIGLLTKATRWIAPLLLRHRWLNWVGVGLILDAAYRLLAAN